MKFTMYSAILIGSICLVACAPKQKTKQEADRSTVPALRVEDDAIELATEDFKINCRKLLYAEKYDELEQIARDGLRENKRFRDGEWIVRKLDEGLLEPAPASEEEWDKHKAKIIAWIERYPESVTAHTAYIEYFKQRAWFYRGPNWAGQVSQDAWSKFEKYLGKAQIEFEKAITLSEKSPELYSRGIIIASALGQKDYAYRIFREGKRRFPEYNSLYRQMAIFLMPRWLGEPGEFERFLKEEALDVGGASAYTYADAVVFLDEYYENIYKETKIEWRFVADGFEKGVVKYVDSRRLLNCYALHCVEAGQRGKAKELFDRIGYIGSKSVWDNVERFRSNRDWAYEK